MVDEVAANMKNTQEKILAISHCNCEERAKAVRDMLLNVHRLKMLLFWIRQESVVCMRLMAE